ncbi:CTP pyrophosphohydrolase, partial [Escherichia coli]|nr:CTP pyrophosphohydrolase [Escherichia coli]
MKMIEVVAAIIERDGKILLAQRPAQSDQAGLWEFAGGKVEPDESQQQALVRELNEELGIEATVGEYVASHQR